MQIFSILRYEFLLFLIGFSFFFVIESCGFSFWRSGLCMEWELCEEKIYIFLVLLGCGIVLNLD